MTSLSPDVYVIVADCLRNDAFPPGGREPVDHWPRGAEFVRFPRTVSSASWTLPAHISILSGLRSDQHGVHRLGLSRVPADLPWLPSALKGRGYRTLLLSANHTLGPDSGFGRGFDELAWGRWGENAFRLSTSSRPPYSSEQRANRDTWKESILMGEERVIGRTAARAVANLPRFPWLLDASARLARKLLLPRDANFDVTPWIEPTFEGMLSRTPSAGPVFALINLMDCHEPYLPSLLEYPNWRAWWRVGRVRQDRTNWTYGAWPYSAEELAILRSLYAHQANAVGRRIGGLLGTLERAGRLAHSLVVVTSDHGQALGEHQRLFHNGGLSEPEVRVPLWIRFPHGRQPLDPPPDWTSLVDIYPTVASELHWEAEPRATGLSLGTPSAGRRPEPAIAVADGIFTPEEYSSVGARCRWSASVAAYDQDLKVVVDSTPPRTTVFDLGTDPEERHDLGGRLDGRAGELADQARRILRALEAPLAAGERSAEVEERLTSWGYLA